MTNLDEKINQYFPGLVVRKDLVKTVKGNAVVPTYVLEYLLGQYCATNDEATINSGIDTVKEILRKHYVNRSESGLIRSNIKEKGRYKVIDKISVSLNDKLNVYHAEFSNLGIKEILVDSGTVKAHPKLLVSGVWSIADIEYDYTEDRNVSPWILASLKPIQQSHFSFEAFVEARKNFTTEEWIDLLIQSIGFNPEMFGRRTKLLQLTRLIPYCERNYNLLELGPKGTGKSHIFSEFSPHGILLSGGEVSVPKLFVNNQSGKIGLVGYWDVVSFDEFAGKKKRVDKALVDIMKNYMANKSFSRGVETLGAEASMVFIGNTAHTVPFMLKHSDLFDDLPEKYHDSAFLDRIHFYLPGWEMSGLRFDMYSSGFGFVVDYFAEILRHLRSFDFSDRYKEKLELSSAITTRDRDGINKTFSGLMKILFPHGEVTSQEVEDLLRFSIEGRKRVKDQLLRIDSTFDSVHFAYLDRAGQTKSVTTLEEDEYPKFYHKSGQGDRQEELALGDSPAIINDEAGEGGSIRPQKPKLREQHLTFQENQKGVSYDKLFGAYLNGVAKITITDPYIRMFYQIRNLMEFLETVVKHKQEDQEVSIHLITAEDISSRANQAQNFEMIRQSCEAAGIDFTWEFDKTGTIHARHIVLDNGWKISLDRGLDIFQHYEMNDALVFSNRLQEFRACKAFEVTFIAPEAST